VKYKEKSHWFDPDRWRNILRKGGISMFRKKRILCLYLISAFVFIFSVQPAFTQELTPAKKTAIAWVDGSKANFEEIAKYLWENPELSLVELKSSAKLQEYLAKNGFKIEKGIAGMPSAFVATWGSGKPVIGFLTEYDALPGISQQAGKAVREAVIPGAPGQGCGHNLYGPTGVTAAIATKVAMEKHGIKGTIKLFGCPAEETLVGKIFMAREGVFDGTDIMISYHPWDFNGVNDSSWLAMTSVKFQFKGRSAHAALAPHAGRSALDAVELMDIAMNFMREHVIQEARIHYVITNGGLAPNVVPPEAEVWYFIRSPRRTQVDEIFNWMQDVAKGATLMTQTTMTHKLLAACWEVLPNKVLNKLGDANIKGIGAPPFTPEDQKFGEEIIKSLGGQVKGETFDTTIRSPDLVKTFPNITVMAASTDEGNVSWMVPTISFRSATAAKGTPLHTWQMVCQTGTPTAFKAALTASKWMAATALDCLTKPETIPEAWKEHNQYLSETKYYHPIPSDLKVPTFKDLYGIEPGAVPGAKK
jgi:aminobenzoyl-glutamate utilization protein B